MFYTTLNRIRENEPCTEGTCPDCKGGVCIRKYLEDGNLLLGCSRCDYEKIFEYGRE